MSTNERGCWSCRARRKRCDGRTPRCNTCDRLGIDCAGFGSSRPNWMDGGVQQRAYCGWLKNVVKSARRQQSHTQRRLYSDSSSNFSQTQQSPLWLASPTSPVEIAIPDTAPYQVQTPWTDPGPSSSLLKADPRIEYWLAQSLDWETNTELFSPGLDEGDLGGLNCTMPEGYFDTLIADPQQDQASPPSPKQGMPNLAELSQGNADCEPDWLLLMRYFDCTMQRLFPFHCQVEHIDERGYMLHLAHRSSIVRIALISTVSYDFEQLWTDAQPQHADAKASATNSRWLTYYHQASELIQPELETLFSNNNHTSPNSRHNLALEALVSLVHLLLLGFVADDKNVIKMRFQQGCQVLELLDSTTSSQVSGPQSRLQSFFTSIFLRWLVFRRTTQPQEPPWSCLADTLQDLLENNLCGYATSLLEAISQIADLAAWKSSSAAAGILSTLELAKRAIGIEAKLAPFADVGERQLLHNNDDKTRSMNGQNGGAEPPLAPTHCFHRGCSCCFCIEAKATTTTFTTLQTCPLHAYRQSIANTLLAHSARIFLYTVVSGPNPRLPEIQAVVRSAAQLLRLNETAMGSIALSWPLAVMVNMAVDIQEREVLSSAVTACRRTWAYPSEQGQIDIGQGLSLRSLGLY